MRIPTHQIAKRALRLYVMESLANRKRAAVYGANNRSAVTKMSESQCVDICIKLGIDYKKPEAAPAPAPAVDIAALRAAIIREVEDKVRAEYEAKLKAAQEGKAVQNVISFGDKKRADIVIKDAHHPQYPALLRAASARLPHPDPAKRFVPGIWLSGPTSSGKSHAACALAEVLGLKFYLASCMAQQYELLGFKDANGNYHTTQFRTAFEFGGVILLDEIDSWDSNVTLALNGALANGYAAFPDKMVARHKDCVIIGAANTWGLGASAEFVGRNKLDAAFMSRFPVKFDWVRDENLERAISGNEQFANRVQAARRKAVANGLKVVIDGRHMLAGSALIEAGFTEDEAARLTYMAGLSIAQVAMIAPTPATPAQPYGTTLR
jgi:hypothetical protein